ncbi:MAG: SIMPL domain-containing protein [Saprospiraceae bacterium]|nr:SIMPL domain-containing protein [Saprospiraceae bacterium]
MSKNYQLIVYSEKDLESVLQLNGPGVKVSSVNFGYSSIDPGIEESLIMDSINDAKRKANRIVSNLDMKLGKIISIEDTSSGCCKTIKDSKTKTTKIKYSVNVKFELK